MVSKLASSVVDREFEPRSGQTKDYEIGSCWLSAKHAALKRKNKVLVGSVILHSGFSFELRQKISEAGSAFGGAGPNCSLFSKTYSVVVCICTAESR